MLLSFWTRRVGLRGITVVDRVHGDEPRRRLAIGGHRSAQGAPQQLRPKALTLVRAVEGETGHEDRRNDVRAAGPVRFISDCLAKLHGFAGLQRSGSPPRR